MDLLFIFLFLAEFFLTIFEFGMFTNAINDDSNIFTIPFVFAKDYWDRSNIIGKLYGILIFLLSIIPTILFYIVIFINYFIDWIWQIGRKEFTINDNNNVSLFDNHEVPLMFEVVRPKDTVIVLIMKHKTKDTYSYVNLTKGHICPCEFSSVEDAIKDMDRLKRMGKLISYRRLFD